MIHALPLYAELHCLSNFSFQRGASHPAELVARAHELGYRALAITDECSVAGVVRAYAAWKELPVSNSAWTVSAWWRWPATRRAGATCASSSRQRGGTPGKASTASAGKKATSACWPNAKS